MRILIVHNRYQEKGGEDAVVASEKALLAQHGVDVEYLQQDNDGIVTFSDKIAASISVFYSGRSVELLNASIRRFQPDAVHVHNWFPTFSPGIFWACRKQGIPVVHTLHNYRLLCATGNLSRDGGVCEDCMDSTFRTPGIIHACYRESRAGTAIATAAMLTHWKIGTWYKAVDQFIALTEFAKKKLVQGGLPAEKIVVKPNFLDYDPGFRPRSLDYFLFVGRLTEAKGVAALLKCWREGADLPLLRIAGEGPLAEEVEKAAASLKNLEWLGWKNPDDVLDLMGDAKALICPSRWYEGMPRVVIESLAVGTPVVAPRLGSYPEMIAHGKYGVLFDPNDPQGLVACIRDFNRRDAFAQMRIAAREEFESHYTGPANFKLLQDIYRRVIPDGQGASERIKAGYVPAIDA